MNEKGMLMIRSACFNRRRSECINYASFRVPRRFEQLDRTPLQQRGAITTFFEG
jgi:hypothetical protein